MQRAVLTDGTEIECSFFEESEGGISLREVDHDLIAFVPPGEPRYVLAEGVPVG